MKKVKENKRRNRNDVIRNRTEVSTWKMLGVTLNVLSVFFLGDYPASCFKI
jgi:hypothetical protein